MESRKIISGCYEKYGFHVIDRKIAPWGINKLNVHYFFKNEYNIYQMLADVLKK